MATPPPVLSQPCRLPYAGAFAACGFFKALFYIPGTILNSAVCDGQLPSWRPPQSTEQASQPCRCGGAGGATPGPVEGSGLSLPKDLVCGGRM